MSNDEKLDSKCFSDHSLFTYSSDDVNKVETSLTFIVTNQNQLRSNLANQNPLQIWVKLLFCCLRFFIEAIGHSC